MARSYPAYLELFEQGELKRRARAAAETLADCTLCARQCHADRRANPPASYCRTGVEAVVSSFFPHHGEEPCLRGRHGSGTIFFTHCNLRCVFCQNYEISCLGEGRPVTAEELARMMLALQDRGCHNINLVTPSHVVAAILESLCLAVERGLRLPLVYNTGGYDSLASLRLLDGVVDIYMPDVKFWDPQVGEELAHASDYAEVVCAAVREMHRQVGDLELDAEGLARRGLLVRHLVLPNQLAGTREVMRFLAREISPNTLVNIMGQYHPDGESLNYTELGRHVTLDEFRQALAIAYEEGIRRINQG